MKKVIEEFSFAIINVVPKKQIMIGVNLVYVFPWSGLLNNKKVSENQLKWNLPGNIV